MSAATVGNAKTRIHGSPAEAGPKAACVSAPGGVDTSAIRKALESRGVRVFSPDELDLPGQNLTQILREAVQRADLIVAVVDSTPASNFVFFEVGLAQGMNKPATVLLLGDASSATWAASGIPYFRFDPEQPSALDFAITQILAVPHPGTEPPLSPAKRTRPLGNRADELLAQLHIRGDNITPSELEEIIGQALRDSDVTSISKGDSQQSHVAFAVWCDDLSPWIGNPLAIELRRTLRTGQDLTATVGQLTQAMARGSMPWGLLIYLRSPIDVASAITAPHILGISAEQFLESLRATGFGELVRNLRRQRVHGGC